MLQNIRSFGACRLEKSDEVRFVLMNRKRKLEDADLAVLYMFKEGTAICISQAEDMIF